MSFHPHLAATLLLVALATSCSPASNSPAPDATADQPADRRSPPWFQLVSVDSGFDFRHASGATTNFWIPEMMGGGVGLLDFDRDGLLDIFCVQSGLLSPQPANPTGCRLYRNLGNWRFTNVTENAGVAARSLYGMGCAVADYDSDGWPDIYVTGLGGNILLRNRGDGTFEDTTGAAGVAGNAWGTSAAFSDYDLDGRPDLVVANYIRWSPATEKPCYSKGGRRDYCSPMSYRSPAMDTLFHNDGNGRFSDVTARAGLGAAFGNGLGVICADFNRDGRIDLFVANDAMANQLWINQGDGTFKDEALLRGCALNILGIAEAGMGVITFDLLQRGWLDLFITHLEGEANRLYLNTNGFFLDHVAPRGPGAVSWPYTGFGTVAADFDNDGLTDLYVANGKVKFGQREFDTTDPYAEPNNLLRGLGNGDFEEIHPHGGTVPELIATSRGLAAGDLDNDGAIDLVIINRDGSAHLLRNVTATRHSWIILRLLDSRKSDALNTWIRLDAGGRRQWLHHHPNQGYCSSQDPRAHFGLGQADTIDRLRLLWPDGTQEDFGPFPARQIVELTRGRGRSVPVGDSFFQ